MAEANSSAVGWFACLREGWQLMICNAVKVVFVVPGGSPVGVFGGCSGKEMRIGSVAIDVVEGMPLE